jgi:hypothetical protein
MDKQSTDMEEVDINEELRKACFTRNAKRAKELLEQGADVNYISTDWPNTPLQIAIMDDENDELMRVLLDAGADITVNNRYYPEKIIMTDEKINKQMEKELIMWEIISITDITGNVDYSNLSKLQVKEEIAKLYRGEPSNPNIITSWKRDKAVEYDILPSQITDFLIAYKKIVQKEEGK